MYGGVVGGAGAATAAAVVLPNTGDNRVLMVVSAVTLVVGIAITVTTLARLVAKKVFQA